MKKTLLATLSLLLCATISSAQEPTEDTKPEKRRRSFAEQIESYKAYQQKIANYEKFRIGSYGEMLYQHYDYGPNRYSGTGTGSPADSRGTIAIPRFIVAMDYKFTPKLTLSTEIEFEYGGTGAAMEYEYDEAGEYEMEIERAGEVALEQFHLTYELLPSLKLRAGHIIVPVGLTNAYHEPVNFFGATRPEGEMNMIPCTWHENGIQLLGSVKGFNYWVELTNGLDPNFFSRDKFIREGKQSMFETAVMTNPAVSGRLEYNIKGFRVGASAYYGRTAKNSSKPDKMSSIKAPVTIATADMQYRGHNIIARGNVVYGHIGDSEALSRLNITMPSGIGFSRDYVAESAINYYGEIGYNVGRLIRKSLAIYPFVRYEYYDTMHSVKGTVVKDDRYECSVLTAGLNYYVLPGLVIKADYAHRRVGGGKFNNENTFSIGIAYITWFAGK